ncbi:hypothetical protein RHGRI_014446 [Rhododendron griersonianum]|uniref:Uncharacterized protein n=1 Tax=Rhododendron griersonianum TaxID=479676 RepID=A0AAV6K9B3_9ERIC|nr:hypothetical protein RHGRI_014446 [Rhododendron griersonianum]
MHARSRPPNKQGKGMGTERKRPEKEIARDANRRQAVRRTETRPKNQVGGGSRIIATHRRHRASPLRNR